MRRANVDTILRRFTTFETNVSRCVPHPAGLQTDSPQLGSFVAQGMRRVNHSQNAFTVRSLDTAALESLISFSENQLNGLHGGFYNAKGRIYAFLDRHDFLSSYPPSCREDVVRSQ